MTSHLKSKAIAAAAALVLSGAAAATPLTGEDLFFTAWNGNPDAASSIVINLGITASEFRANPNAPFALGGASLTTLSTWLTSLGSGVSGVQWNLSGASLGPQNSPTYGLLTTSTDIETRDPGGWGQFTGLDAAVGNYPIYFVDVNGGLASTDAYFASNPLQLFSPSFNGGVGINGLARVGDSVEFYAMFVDQDGNEFFEGDYASFGGSWTLGFAGGVASLAYVTAAPVPIPAAVWLFGSGLLGLFGIGRRKAA